MSAAPAVERDARRVVRLAQRALATQSEPARLAHAAERSGEPFGALALGTAEAALTIRAAHRREAFEAESVCRGPADDHRTGDCDAERVVDLIDGHGHQPDGGRDAGAGVLAHVGGHADEAAARARATARPCWSASPCSHCRYVRSLSSKA